MQKIRASLSAVPALTWLREYQVEWLRPDLVAGLTLAAYLLPAGIGDASLAGPAAGGRPLRLPLLRAGVLALLQLAPHGDHRHVGDLAADRRVARRAERDGDRHAHAALAACTALLVGGDRVRSRGCSRRRVARQLRLRDRAGRLQGRRRAVPREHAAAEALRLQGRRTATSGSAWRTSSRTSARRTRRRCSLGLAALAVLVARQDACCSNRPVALFVVVGGHRSRRVRSTSARTASSCSARCRRACRALGLPAVEPARPERARCRSRWRASCSAPSRPPRSGACSAQKHGYRLDTNQEFLALARREPRRRPRPRLPGQRRHVAVARQRERRRAHAAVGARRRAAHPGRRAVPLGPAARPAAARARGDRAGGGHRPVQGRGAAAPLALQPRRVRRRDGGAARRARLGSRPRRADRRGALDRAPAAARVAAARDRARPHARHDATSPTRRATRRTSARRACSSSALRGALCTSTSITCASVSSSSSPAFAIRRGASSSWARCRTSISPARSSWRTCTRRSARGIEFRLADVHGQLRDALRRIGFEREHGPLESAAASTPLFRMVWRGDRAA